MVFDSTEDADNLEKKPSRVTISTRFFLWRKKCAFLEIRGILLIEVLFSSKMFKRRKIW